MTHFDPHHLKQDFPILQRTINNHSLVYLDNAATTHKPVAVLDALDSYYTQHNANIHRGVHILAEEATLLYEQARVKVKDFINARAVQEIIFTRGTTESLNLVASTWGLDNLKAGQQIVLTHMEHHANLLPWQRLAQQTGAELVFIPVDDQGQLVDSWPDYITEQTKLVAITHISNVLGTINPVQRIIQTAHQVGALVVVDAAQSAPYANLDVRHLDVDFMAFSGHKMLGPTGIGVLYGKQALLESMSPYQLGGEMIKNVSLTSAEWQDLPHKFEAGTPPIAQAVGLGVAIDYLRALDPQLIQRHQQAMTQYALDQLGQIPGLTIYGSQHPSQRTAILSFNLQHVHPHDVASIVDQQGIAIRSGHHCAQPLTESLGVPATARASFYIYNTTEDVDSLVQALLLVEQKLA